MLTIGTVAKRVGLRPSAIRYYETRGLLRPSSRLPNGYRVYREDAVRVLRFLLRAQSFGFTLKEVKELLELARNGQRPCARVRKVARHHLQNVEAKIRELQSLRGELRRLVALGPNVPARAGDICPLIDSGPK